MAIRVGRERPEKILVAMHQLSGRSTDFLKYEDIVVKAFSMFPDEFALRGYPEFPDSSDVHKPLYGVLKKRGLVKAADKNFSLTQLGVEVAERLIDQAGASLEEERNPRRLTRAETAELERMRKSEAYRMFMDSQSRRILDIDFFAFLGCTVRTSKNDFIGRMKSCDDAIKAAKRLAKPDSSSAESLDQLWTYLKDRFKKEISWKTKKSTAKFNHLRKQRPL